MDKNLESEGENKKDLNSIKEPKEKKKESLKDSISIKELIILTVGIIAIFAVILIIPAVFEKEPLSITEMHIENYNKEPSETNYIYNKFSFLKLPDERTKRLFWYTQYKSDNEIYDLPMHYGPKEVENISIEVINPTENKNYSNILYITATPADENVSRGYLGIAISEINEKFTTIKRYNILSAYSKNNSFTQEGIAIVTCDNSEEHIVFQLEDNKTEAKVLIDGNCFIIQGHNESLIRAADRLIYRFLDIMVE